MHSETHQKKYFPEPREIGHVSSFGHIFQPELQKKFWKSHPFKNNFFENIYTGTLKLIQMRYNQTKTVEKLKHLSFL